MEQMIFWKLQKREEDSASRRNTCHQFYHKSLEEEKLWNILNQNSKLPSCWQRMMEIRYEKSTISLNTNCFQNLQHSWKPKVRESKYFGKGRKAARCFQSREHILHNYVRNVYCGQGISKPHTSESKGNITKSKCKFVACAHNWEFAETHPQARKWCIYCWMQKCWDNTYYWQQQTLTPREEQTTHPFRICSLLLFLLIIP